MKKIIKYFLCLLVFSTSIYGQRNLSNGDRDFDNYNFFSAVKVYENMYFKGYKSPDLLKKIGDSYYFQSKYEESARWYAELFSLGQSVSPEYYYRYAQSLKSVGDYIKADVIMMEYEKRSKDEIRSKLAFNNKDYLKIIERNSGRYELENTSISSSYSDYGAFVFDNKIIFTSTRDINLNASKNHKWNDEPFSNLYQAEFGQDGTITNVSLFNKSLNSKFHESSAVITKDGKTIYFTRNSLKKDKKNVNTKNVKLLKLCKATFDGKKWVNIQELPFNSDDYSVAHPALSQDEKTLYFVSDMPGSFGQSDLYKVAINGENDYGTPINLGNEINTEGKESFPFISGKNELYFSSDGHPGLGGLDVFVSSIDAKGNFRNVQNVGEPVNSLADDFSFYIDTKTSIGFVSSNRKNGLGSDDIYKFKETKKLSEVCVQTIKGIATDSNTGKALAFAKVILLDEYHNIIKDTKSDKDGNYNFGSVDCNSKFIIRLEMSGFQTVEKDVFVDVNSGLTNLDFKTSPPYQKLKIGQDVGKFLDINPIYFDFNKSFIRQDEELELNKLLSLLELYPNLEILIKSHTDSRGSAHSNQILSEKRSSATLEWLVAHGVKKSRLKAIGYGESELIIKCYNENDCPEEVHQLNRRSEFIITKM